MELSGFLSVLERPVTRQLGETWGLDTLQSHKDRAKLKWWYKLVTLPEDKCPEQLFKKEWNIKQRRGRQVWSGMVNDLFKSLDIRR